MSLDKDQMTDTCKGDFEWVGHVGYAHYELSSQLTGTGFQTWD